MKITIFGLALTSSWGNGHATTYRALCSALAKRGHSIVFFENNAEWYANNRDVEGLPAIKIVRYDSWSEIASRAKAEIRDCDVALLGSYFPDARNVTPDILNANRLKAFYDIDTPVTLSQLRESGSTSYLRASDIPHFDIYFSFSGGPSLRELETR